MYLFGSTCAAVTDGSGNVVITATPDNIRDVSDKVATCDSNGGTELLAAVQHVMTQAIPNHRRHNVMILTDGEVSERQSQGIKSLLAPLCPATALVGIIGFGDDVTRTTLRNVVGGGMGPQALVFDGESEDGKALNVNDILQQRLTDDGQVLPALRWRPCKLSCRHRCVCVWVCVCVCLCASHSATAALHQLAERHDSRIAPPRASEQQRGADGMGTLPRRG